MTDVKVLAMGTVVKIAQDLENDYMVIARTIVKENEQNSVKYILLNHPYGGDSSHDPVTIDERDISEVIFEGYSDSKDEAYIQELLLEAEQAVEEKNAGNVTQTPAETQSKMAAPVIEEQPDGDPFYKFRESHVADEKII
ncbi:MAG: DUF4176 domain-containing protein [Streptococcaceae bacterium]|jgi:hypothetical protein|nr:DUF4176 domain-containing protein [Streptococcaceae bacterium]